MKFFFLSFVNKTWIMNRSQLTLSSDILLIFLNENEKWWNLWYLRMWKSFEGCKILCLYFIQNKSRWNLMIPWKMLNTIQFSIWLYNSIKWENMKLFLTNSRTLRTRNNEPSTGPLNIYFNFSLSLIPRSRHWIINTHLEYYFFWIMCKHSVKKASERYAIRLLRFNVVRSGIFFIHLSQKCLNNLKRRKEVGKGWEKKLSTEQFLCFLC